MSRPATPNVDVHILEMVVAPHELTLSRLVARAVNSLSFTEAQQSKIHRLLDKNNSGTISNRERKKLDGYSRVGNFLNLLKAKARASLYQPAGG